MSDQVVTLRIVGENGKLVAAVKTSKAEIEGLSKTAQTAGKDGSKGLEEVGKGAKKSERNIKSMSLSLGTLGADAKKLGTVAGVALVAIGAGVAKMAVDLVRSANDIRRLSDLANVSTDAFQKMAAGATTAGISQEKLADIFKDTQDKIGDFLQNGAGPMADFFDNIAPRVGVTAAQFRKLSGPDALQLYASSLQKANLSSAETVFYMEALASDSALLTPLLRDNGKGFKDWGDEAAKAGAVMDGETLVAARKLGEQMQRLRLNFDGMWKEALPGLLPKLGEFADLLNSPEFREGFATLINGAVTAVGALVKLATTTANVTKFLGEEIAARVHGPALDDVVRVADRIDRLKTTLAAVRDQGPTKPLAIMNASELTPADLISTKDTIIKRLQGELDKEENKLQIGVKMGEDAARRAAALAAEAAKAPVVGTGTGNPWEGPNAAEREAAMAAAAEGEKAAARARAELAKFRDELERTEAQLAGPLAEAEYEHAQRLSELADLLKAGTIGQREYDQGKAQSEDQTRRTVAAIAREQDVLGRVQADYEELIYLSGLSTQARRVEEEVIRAVNEAIDAGKPLREDEIEDLRKFIKESQRVVEVKDAHQQAAEDYQRNWQGAISSVAGAMGDFFASGLRDSKSFTQGIKDIFKRWLSNVIAIFAEGRLKKAFAGVSQSVSGWMSNLSSGASGSSSGGLMKSVLGMFTGGSGGGGGMLSGMYSAFTNGFSAAGAAGGGMWSSLASGFSGAVSAFTGSLGLAGTATTAYSSAISGLAATYGGTAVGGSTVAATTVGTAGMGAAAGVSWIPIVGWIVAGIMASSAAFKGGWDMQGQKGDISKWMMSKGNIGGAIDNAGVSFADNALKALGFSDSWAAAFSGSGLQTKLFGHKKPKVQGQGIQGSIGFGGITGESYADIKAKGGWFRSDKKWTETGEMDSTIARAFDNASAAISMRAGDLADQMGVDITAALAAVSLDIGKIQFDGDPEKARQQITDKIAEVMEGLSAEAVKALGFNRLLDDGFAAGEIMGALSSSIALVTGSSERLGQSLSALEIENVTRAVEYFESLAIKNGTGLGDQIGRTVGLLGEYSSLITGIDTELQTRDLNQYQSAQLQIELQYRNQIKSANQLAKALGLTGARAEDLAKIEQLRAVNMASLQTAMEAQKNTFLDDLGLSDLSPLRDDQKLVESMQLLRDAVGSGDLQRAQQLSQTALGLGRNLYASGADYSGLYGEVTGLISGIAPAGMEGFSDLQLDNIADILTGLPDGIASAMFNLLYGPAVADTSVLPPPPIAPLPPPGLTPGRPGRPALGPGDDGTYAMLAKIEAQLAAINGHTGGSLQMARGRELAALNVR